MNDQRSDGWSVFELRVGLLVPVLVPFGHLVYYYS